MQDTTDSYQALGESSSPNIPVESRRSPDGPCLSSGKSKKRERFEQSTTAGKKFQLMEDYTSPQKLDCTENLVDDGGGLANIAAVDHLLYKMKQEKSAPSQRITAAKILSGTTKDDCLKKFVLLGGVSILEEWIQEGSKVRSSDASMKDGDKVLDEEMMVILQALEKLPISLETLKGCSIGKSVKQLRSVRNGEIQKRARKLVDTWRKRVDLEMKQSIKVPAAVLDRTQHLDSMSCASDLSPGKGGEANNQLVVNSGFMHLEEGNATAKSQTLVLTFSKAATLEGAANELVKAVSPEKDSSKKAARMSASSITSASSLSPAKKQKHASLLCMDKDFKDEASNTLDCQKLKERDLKCENSSTYAGNEADRKTNEYRKKLRSGGASAAPCNTDSHAMTGPCSAVQNRENHDGKAVCIDNNVGDSEQQQVELLSCQEKDCVGTRVGNEAPDSPGICDRGAGNKDGNAIQLHPQDGRPDRVIESCLSSQSSCTEKRNIAGPKVVVMVGKTSSSTSPLQGDAKLYPVLNVVSEQAIDSFGGKEATLLVSTKSLSSGNNDPDVGTRKLSPKSEPKSLSDSVANNVVERNGPANLTHVGEVGAVYCEESCCSHNTDKGGHVGVAAATQHEEKVSQGVAEHSPNYPAVREGASIVDGAACSDITKLVVNACQESEKEAGSKGATPSSAAYGSIVSNIASEAHMTALEIPAVSQSCHDFDLNEGLAMDDFTQEAQPFCGLPASTSAMASKVTGTLSTPIAVSAATKGAFIPSLNAPCKSDIGWRGSAATSAFRPAEPRNASAKTQPFLAPFSREVRHVNSFDLNIAEQDTFEDCTSFSGQHLQEAYLDLNRGGKENETRTLITDLPMGCSGKFAEKRAVLDFDLNEQLNEVPHEQHVLSTSAARSYDSFIPYGGLSGRPIPGDVTSWNSTEGSTYSGATTVGPRIELFSSSSASQPTINSRQVTSTAIVPPPLPSVVYSQTAPFFGGSPQTPFPASFAYNPMSVGPEPSFMGSKGMPDTSFMVSKGLPDTPFMVSKGMPGTYAPSVGVRSRAETSVRPTFLTSIDDLRGSNNFYTWGRAPQNIYGNSGATIISYNDAAVAGREHVVNFDGSASLEEQMRLFQQAAVPVSSLKGRDPEYFSGLKQTWH
ncbi:hypothetical protein L7F22_045106 [Adiantum nelumboides]|nr:hypothetical protein [Adiantum nelumboides]